MRVAFLGSDLIMFSKVAKVARDLHCELVRGQTEGTDLVFVDLNNAPLGLAQIPAAVLSGAQVVGFCGHEAKDVRQLAMTAGAALCVTNGTLAETVRRLIIEKTEKVQ